MSNELIPDERELTETQEVIQRLERKAVSKEDVDGEEHSLYGLDPKDYSEEQLQRDQNALEDGIAKPAYGSSDRHYLVVDNKNL